MYPVSTAFLEAVNSNTRKYRWTGTITTTAGKTYEFENKDIVQGSGYITRECCGSSEIELGTVYAAGQKVTIKGNLWFHQYERVGGDSVDFVRKFYGKSYPEAVEFLHSGDSEIVSSFSAVQACKPFVLPKANDNMRRTFAYLFLTRGIDCDVMCDFVRKRMIYESADYHNAVFVGYDLSGTPRHAHKHGTVSNNSYKGNVASSQPEYSFHWHGQSDKIFLFEAPIDMLSFISMHKENWQNHSYAAACSVSDKVLFQSLKDNPNIKNVYLCFDNDRAGQAANRRIAEKLEQENIQTKILVPENKDWNEDILLRNGGEFVCNRELSR